MPVLTVDAEPESAKSRGLAAGHSRAPQRGSRCPGHLPPPRAAGSVRIGAADQLIPLSCLCLPALRRSQLLRTSARPLPSNFVQPRGSPVGPSARRQHGEPLRNPWLRSPWRQRVRGIYTRELQLIASVFYFSAVDASGAISARVNVKHVRARTDVRAQVA